MRAVIETCYLEPAAWRLAARLAQAAGCDGVVCATGLGPEGATPAAIAALRGELPRRTASSRRRAASARSPTRSARSTRAPTCSGVADAADLLAELAEAAAARRRRPAAG